MRIIFYINYSTAAQMTQTFIKYYINFDFETNRLYTCFVGFHGDKTYNTFFCGNTICSYMVFSQTKVLYKWSNKHYLNAAKREIILERVKFETCVDKSKRDQKVVLHDVLYSSCIVFAAEKLRSFSELTFQYISYRIMFR
jgi:hypothetical protein